MDSDGISCLYKADFVDTQRRTSNPYYRLKISCTWLFQGYVNKKVECHEVCKWQRTFTSRLWCSLGSRILKTQDEDYFSSKKRKSHVYMRKI